MAKKGNLLDELHDLAETSSYDKKIIGGMRLMSEMLCTELLEEMHVIKREDRFFVCLGYGTNTRLTCELRDHLFRTSCNFIDNDLKRRCDLEVAEAAADAASSLNDNYEENLSTWKLNATAFEERLKTFEMELPPMDSTPKVDQEFYQFLLTK